jgi:hypothetical protein
MNFLETITFLGNEALVPINRIKYVNFLYGDKTSIKIVSDDGDWEEHFGHEEEKAIARYEEIKKILKGK